MTNKLSRRRFFKASVGVMSALCAADVLAQTCQDNGAPQPLGPFFPRPQTPEIPTIENSHSQLPIYLANDNDLTVVKGVNGIAQGQVVYVSGVVTNSDCKPVPGATIVIWQASESGRYNHLDDAANQDFFHPKTGEKIRRHVDPAFQYWGKAVTDARGEYQFKTIVPGFYPADLATQWYRPPHIHFMVTATGYPQVVTQMYFSGAEIKDNDWIQELNTQDLLLQAKSLSEVERKNLVVDFVKSKSGGEERLIGNFNIGLKAL